MKIDFIRWGNLNPVKHKEARLDSEDENRGYHTAPAFKGFYAFPSHKIEPFLLGGSYDIKRSRYLKDENGNKITVNDFWSDYNKPKDEYKALLKKRGIKFHDLTEIYDEKNEVWYMMYRPKPHRFKYEGPLWHHLEDYVDRKDILAQKGSWVKTNYDVYCKAYKKADTQERFDIYMQYSDRSGNPHTCPNVYSKDHYEVFIERI